MLPTSLQHDVNMLVWFWGVLLLGDMVYPTGQLVSSGKDPAKVGEPPPGHFLWCHPEPWNSHFYNFASPSHFWQKLSNFVLHQIIFFNLFSFFKLCVDLWLLIGFWFYALMVYLPAVLLVLFVIALWTDFFFKLLFL